jgi:acylglycerol lipase
MPAQHEPRGLELRCDHKTMVDEYRRAMRIPVLLAILLAACGGHDPGLRMANRPVLSGEIAVERGQLSFAGHGGVQLYAQMWRRSPAAGPERAVVVIHHGLADHSERYEQFAYRLAEAGYTVWALDMRGHGRSAGVRVAAGSIDDYLDDLDAFMQLVRSRESGKQIYLFGHSLGGLIATLYTIERRPQLAGLVLSGPAVALDAPPIQIAAIRVIAGLAPNAPVLDTPHANFSSSKDVIDDMNQDPLIFQGKGPAKTARALIDGASRVWAHPEHITMPLLVVAGSVDKLTAPSGGRDLVAHAGTADRTFMLYDHLAHDLLHEPNGNGARVASDILAWLDAHVDGKPSPLASAQVGKLKGDRPPMALEIELDGRAEHVRDASENGGSGGLRVRAMLGGRIGWYAGIDARVGGITDAYYEADLHALGLAWRCPCGALVGVSGGIGIGGVRGNTATHIPVELVAELPLGPVRLLARGGLGWRLSGDKYASDAHGLADEASALIGIRLGRDVHYWANVVAGSGPYLAVTYRNLGGGELIGLALGVNLFGGN